MREKSHSDWRATCGRFVQFQRKTTGLTRWRSDGLKRCEWTFQQTVCRSCFCCTCHTQVCRDIFTIQKCEISSVGWKKYASRISKNIFSLKCSKTERSSTREKPFIRYQSCCSIIMIIWLNSCLLVYYICFKHQRTLLCLYLLSCEAASVSDNEL